jgi:hypothetical protein
MWFDAADTSTIAATGSNVSSWTNKATFSPTITITPNASGLPSTTGNRTSTGLNYINIPFGGELRYTAAFNTQARSWFWVVRNNTPSANWSFMQLLYPANQTTGQDQLYIGRSSTTYTLYQQPFNTVRISANITNPIGNINAYTIINSATTSSNVIATNGATNSLGTNTSATGYSTSSLTYSINVRNQTNYRVSLDVFEILFYTRDLTDSERQQVE